MVVHCSCAGRWHSNFLIPGTPQGQSFSDFLLESAIMGVILGKPVRLFEACFSSLLLGKFLWGLGDEVRGMSFKLKKYGIPLNSDPYMLPSRKKDCWYRLWTGWKKGRIPGYQLIEQVFFWEQWTIPTLDTGALLEFGVHQTIKREQRGSSLRKYS